MWSGGSWKRPPRSRTLQLSTPCQLPYRRQPWFPLACRPSHPLRLVGFSQRTWPLRRSRLARRDCCRRARALAGGRRGGGRQWPRRRRSLRDGRSRPLGRLRRPGGVGVPRAPRPSGQGTCVHRIELSEVETVLQTEGARITGSGVEATVVFVAPRLVAVCLSSIRGGTGWCETPGCLSDVVALPHASRPNPRCRGVASYLHGKVGQEGVAGSAHHWSEGQAPPRRASGHAPPLSLHPQRGSRRKPHRSCAAAFAGAIASRLQPWRMGCLPFVWFLYAQVLRRHGGVMRGCRT